MRIIEEGHIYQLSEVETNQTDQGRIITKVEPANTIRFVNNEGPNFYNGTQSQEILRTLIDRTMHCDNCLRWPTNDKIIFHLRMALVLHEARALERKTEKELIMPEHIIIANDGHYSIEHFSNIDALSSDFLQYRDKEK